MQNSLNQAFIRAYAKERDAVHAQAVSSAADSRAALLRANEELMLRVDTATVEIPRAHVTGRPAISQNAPAPALERRCCESPVGRSRARQECQ